MLSLPFIIAMRKFVTISVIFTCLFLFGCEPQAPDVVAGVTSESWGRLPDGREVTLFHIVSPSGMKMDVTNYGGIITLLTVPDRNGKFADIVLGFDSLESYLENTPYFGAIIGRYGNRIAEGRFSLDGENYELALNNGANHLHGGLVGFDKVLWDAEPFSDEENHGVIFKYESADGEEGYPGNLSVEVKYRLTPDSRVVFSYKATTDKATPVNLTQHTYFNLAGPASNSILGHELMITAAEFIPIDSNMIPTGELRAVDGTPFDFRTPVTIGERINAGGKQLEYGRGYDHNFVLPIVATSLNLVARVFEPSSGRIMTVITTEPGLQFYSGNFLDGTLVGKGGVVYEHRSGFCLETQHFPDSPNQSAFPSTILRPGETYSSHTMYAFTAE